MRSNDAKAIAHRIATIQLAWSNQEFELKVRQGEQLRRALASAAELFEWDAIVEDAVDEAMKDVNKLVKTGGKLLEAELADELAAKKVEMKQLEKAQKELRTLSAKGDFSSPVEYSYVHTAREAHGMGTKTEFLVLEDAQAAEDAANLIEKKTDSWGKLRETMIEQLKQKQKQVVALAGTVGEFTDTCLTTVEEVFATLH